MNYVKLTTVNYGSHLSTDTFHFLVAAPIPAYSPKSSNQIATDKSESVHLSLRADSLINCHIEHMYLNIRNNIWWEKKKLKRAQLDSL